MELRIVMDPRPPIKSRAGSAGMTDLDCHSCVGRNPSPHHSIPCQRIQPMPALVPPG